jgi:hypothetical protein
MMKLFDKRTGSFDPPSDTQRRIRIKAQRRRRRPATDYNVRRIVKTEVQKATKAILGALDPILAKLDRRLADLEQLEIDAQIEPEDGLENG